MKRSMPAACLSMVLLCGSSVAGEAGRPGWLNVRDFGASGSEVETVALTTAGSTQITVAHPGDFRVGQEVMLTRCNPHFTFCHLRPPENPFSNNPLGDAAELRGYNGRAGSWLVYILEIESADPLVFRWTDDMSRTWKGRRVPITFDWQPLSNGVEIKFKRQAWLPGQIVNFAARDLLVTRIERIQGRSFTLQHPVVKSVKDAVVRHCDGKALQTAITGALQQRQNLFFPAGYYRLTGALSVYQPEGIVLEGAGGATTTLDISEGRGACLSISGGTEVTVRNFRMLGHTGLGEGPGWRSFPTASGRACWPVGMKPCQAITIRNTRRVLVENVHASRMNCEAFYCQGDSRAGSREPKAYTQSLTYLRCSVTNCDGNAFNNNDLAENTSVLYCRIQDVGGCTWEGASRFVRFIGNYVRHSGTVAMGNIGSRIEHLEELGSGQHLVADNVFEGDMFYAGRSGGFMIRAAHGATQVMIRNNLFVNFASSGVEVSGMADNRHLPAGIVTVTGNIFDMTDVVRSGIRRTAIDVSASNVIVADNQVYTRGACDPNVTALRLRESSVDLNIHDNLIRNCGRGVFAESIYASVGEVLGPQTFVLGKVSWVPLERRQSHRYQGWNLAWLSGAHRNTLDTIAGFDPETLQFKLSRPQTMHVGDRFALYPPAANWLIRDNTFDSCQAPVDLSCFGSPTSALRDNLFTRGAATGVKQALDVHGRFNLVGNHFFGFDEPGTNVLGLWPDRSGNPLPNVYHRNTFDHCTAVVAPQAIRLWEAAYTRGNRCTACASPVEDNQPPGPNPKP
jgi:hypothetical protein